MALAPVLLVLLAVLLALAAVQVQEQEQEQALPRAVVRQPLLSAPSSQTHLLTSCDHFVNESHHDCH